MNLEEIFAPAEPFLRVGLTVLLTYFTALWIAAIWWTLQDIRARTTDALLQIAATLLVVALNLPGVVLYFMLRPQRTLADLYADSLEEEALIRTVNDGKVCPACQEAVEPDYLFCPWCRTRLRQACQRCERPIMVAWEACPYCGAPRQSPTTASPQPRDALEPSAEPALGAAARNVGGSPTRA